FRQRIDAGEDSKQKEIRESERRDTRTQRVNQAKNERRNPHADPRAIACTNHCEEPAPEKHLLRWPLNEVAEQTQEPNSKRSWARRLQQAHGKRGARGN